MQYTQPWNHYLFEDFLPEEKLQNLQSILTQQQGQFRQDEDDEMEINYRFLPDINLAKFFIGDEFKSFLESTVQHSLKLNPKSLVQLRMMDSSSPAMPAHVDNQDEKSVVCILYVSTNWTPTCGGELCLLASKEENPNSPEAKIIAPISNRMIVFKSEDFHWHCVQPVNNWIRHSIIMEWIIVD